MIVFPLKLDDAITAGVVDLSTASLPSAINAAIFAEDSGGGADVRIAATPGGTSVAKKLYWSDTNSHFRFAINHTALTDNWAFLSVDTGIASDVDPFESSREIFLPLIEDANDATSNGRDGTATGSPAITFGGVTGPDGVLPATVVNGSTQWIDQGDSDALDGATEAGFGIDIKPNAITGTTALIRKWRSSNFAYGLVLDATGKISLLVSDGTNIINHQTPSSAVTVGAWHRIDATYAAMKTTAIYVDGVSQTLTKTNDNPVAAINNNTERLGIGARYNNGSTDQYLDGEIANAEVFSVARSASDILDNVRLRGPNASDWWTVHDGYLIMRRASQSAASQFEAFVPSGTLNHTVTGLTADSEQWFHVDAVSACGVVSTVSASSRLRRVAMDGSNQLIAPAPNAPHAVKLELGQAGLVTAYWQHTNDNGEVDAASFNVYVAEGAAAFNFTTPDHTVSLPVQSVSLGTFADGTVVRVVIRAVTDGAVEETNTNETTATADAAPPVAPASITLL